MSEFNPKITSELIAKFNPCVERFNNWNEQYPGFNGDTLEFLSLKNITAKDKIWVCVRVLPRILVETFAVDCAFSAYAADAAAERERQVDIDVSIAALVFGLAVLILSGCTTFRWDETCYRSKYIGKDNQCSQD